MCDVRRRPSRCGDLALRRQFGDDGPWRPIGAPWGYPAEYDEDCRGQLPALVFNNEPIGPESSVEQDDNPARIAAAYILTFLANHGAYVFHTGPGIRGGGAADVDGSLRRHANFDDLAVVQADRSSAQGGQRLFA